MENRGGQLKDSWRARPMRALHCEGVALSLEVSIGELVSDGRRLYVATIHDVTDRRNAEEEIRNLQDRATRLGKIVEESNNEIYIFDNQDFRFLQVNKGARENLGYTMAELEKLTAYDIKPKVRTREIFMAMIEPLLLGDRNDLRFETVHRRKDGTDYPVEVHLQLFIGDGEPVFVAMIHDITYRRTAEDEILKLNADLEHRVEARTSELKVANRELTEASGQLVAAQTQLVESEKMAALGGLVAGVAHEINTPIGVSVTAASHLQENVLAMRAAYQEGSLKRSTLESFLGSLSQTGEIIMGNLSRAIELISSFKRVAVDQSQDDQRTFVMRECLSSVVLSLLPQWKKGGHTVEIDCDDDLRIEGFPGIVSQIVTNLLQNSMIHAFDDGVGGHIKVTAHLVGQECKLSYSDDGKGMSEEVRCHIFEPFFTTRRGQGGSGLGMHIVYNLVTARLGGVIQCHSHPGEGTNFEISWPLPDSVAGENFESRSSAA